MRWDLEMQSLERPFTVGSSREKAGLGEKGRLEKGLVYCEVDDSLLQYR